MSSSSQSPPSKSQFAKILKLLGGISFWIQLILGIAASITLLLVTISRNSSDGMNNPWIGLGLFLAVVSIIVLGFRIYWAWRYTRLAKQLQNNSSQKNISKNKVLNILKLGLIASILGLLLAFFAAEITTVTVLTKALSQPQGVAVYEPENTVRSLDLFLILADINLIGAHLLGSINSLGLSNWLD
jgi:heme/copper-type cytochrome/quinol oxidase subunit 2